MEVGRQFAEWVGWPEAGDALGLVLQYVGPSPWWARAVASLGAGHCVPDLPPFGVAAAVAERAELARLLRALRAEWDASDPHDRALTNVEEVATMLSRLSPKRLPRHQLEMDDFEVRFGIRSGCGCYGGDEACWLVLPNNARASDHRVQGVICFGGWYVCSVSAERSSGWGDFVYPHSPEAYTPRSRRCVRCEMREVDVPRNCPEHDVCHRCGGCSGCDEGDRGDENGEDPRYHSFLLSGRPERRRRKTPNRCSLPPKGPSLLESATGANLNENCAGYSNECKPEKAV